MKISGWKALGGVVDDRAAHLQGFLKIDMLVERGVFTVSELDDARDFYEIDARAIIEGACNGGAGDDQDIQAAIILNQRMGNGAASTQMSKPEGIVAVHQNACIV